jgi:hypothetical protein
MIIYISTIRCIGRISYFGWITVCAANASNPANDFGWHDPGYIHTAVMTGLTPSTSYSYSYGR